MGSSTHLARRLHAALIGDATAGERTGTPRLPYPRGRSAWRPSAPSSEAAGA